MKYNKGILFYIKSYKWGSIFIKNFTLVLLLFLIPFSAVGGLYYFNTKNMLNNEIMLENASLTKNVRDLSDILIQQADYVASYIMNTTNFQMLMMNDWFTGFQSETDLSLRQFINTVPTFYESIDSVYIYSELNQTVTTAGGITTLSNFSDNSWLNSYKKISDPKMMMMTRTKNNIYPQYISIIKPVYIDGAKKGCVVVNINVKNLLELFSKDKYGAERSVFIVDTTGEILASTEREYFGQSISQIDFLKEISFKEKNQTLKVKFKETDYIISTQYLENYSLLCINATSMSLYKDKLSYILPILLILIVLLVLISFLVAFIIAVNSFKPMRKIISALEEPEKFSEFSDGIRTGNLNELKYIISSMLKTIRHNEEMETELAGKLVLMDKSHFAMLQAQINPHFLYNTLEVINWMAVDITENIGNPISNALSNLGEFFRINTQSSNYFIPLKDEICQTRLYTDILKLRYDDLFDVFWEVDSELLEKSVIKITMQPFIENAVYHGIKPKGRGSITIKVKKVHDEKMLVNIIDTGVGMSNEKLNDLRNSLELGYKESDSHLGIYNVYRRYKIVFGDECQIQVHSEENKGTSVKLTFPFTSI